MIGRGKGKPQPAKGRERLSDKGAISDRGKKGGADHQRPGQVERTGRKAHGWRLECRAVNGTDSQS